MNVTDQMQQELQGLKERSNLRTLPALIHEGREVIAGGQRMLCLLYTSDQTLHCKSIVTAQINN